MIDSISHSTNQSEQRSIEQLSTLIENNNQDLIAELDDLIHDLFDNVASKINNGGVSEQVKYLIFELGVDEATKKIQALAQEYTDTPGQQ